MTFTRLYSILCVFLLSAALPGALGSQTASLSFQPSDEIFLNPERGLYRLRETGMVRGQITPYMRLDPQDLRLIRQEYSLLFRYFGLKEWRAIDLPEQTLRDIEADFKAIRDAGLKVIARFTYSADIGEPDAPLPIILRHLDQLRPVLQRNADVILVVQAGFIGAWGEWHSSTEGNETLANKRAVLEKLIDVVPDRRMLQVRTPRYKQEFLSLPFDSTAAVAHSAAFNGSPRSRIGHHNDCFLSDDNDMGTYWRDNRLDTALAKPYLHLDNRFVPMGGETCRLSPFAECSNALREMGRMRWTFLNGGYHEAVLAAFTSGGCMNEIRRKLGYRFVMLDAEFSAAPRIAGVFRFKLRVANVGWASPFNRRVVELLLRNKRTHDVYAVRLPADPRFWLPGDTVTIETSVGIPHTMPLGSYEILLNLPDPEPALYSTPAYSIRCANRNVWEEATGYNRLWDSLNVRPASSSDRYKGALWFRTAEDEVGAVDPPTEFALLQNYPNPFNAATIIPFRIPEWSAVRIDVFDLLGRGVATLLNEFLPPSSTSYAVHFDATSLASGMYITRMYATAAKGRSYEASRSLLLIK